MKEIIDQANICLENRDDIPTAPLWHMGKVAKFNSEDSFRLLQNTIDYLECKARQNKDFTKEEKVFMKKIFECFWWGGQYHGYKEAAKLADHYVNGNGKKLKINEDVYRTSVIVNDTCSAIKNYLRARNENNKFISTITTANQDFINSKYAALLKSGKRNVSTQGYMLNNGCLLAEQNNQRLKNADNRFYLHASTIKAAGYFTTTWRVESIYDFEPFASNKDYVTHIPLSGSYTLKIPDGLSHYLTTINVARNFDYYAEWTEKWK